MNHQFSIREARSLVTDLSTPSPAIYWLDFLSSIFVGHIAFGAMARLSTFDLVWLEPPAIFWSVRVTLFILTAVCYMRAIMFIHELVHLPVKGFSIFRIAWNLLCGIPLLVPSFLYYPHVDHHRRKHYGTDKDGEYLSLSHEHPANSLVFVAVAAIVPLAAVIRFSIMTPLAWLIPGFQNWMERHASSMIIDIFYIRGDHGPNAQRNMRLQEICCFGWCLGFHCLWYSGDMNSTTPVLAYLLAVTLVLMNNIRTLGAHRWLGDGSELSFEEQLLDSVNYPHRPWITELWGPIGTRYHALHHLFPSMPYHNLGIAHRRLMAGLPKESIYRQTVRLSLISTIVALLRRASERKFELKEVANELHRHEQYGSDRRAA